MSLGKSNRLTLNRKLKEERDYWAERLSSAPASLHLRPDYPMRPDDDAAGRESFRFTFPPSLAQELAKVTGDSPLLLYATLLTALKICLQRYTDNPRVVVGSPPRRKDGEPPPQPNALAIVDQFESSHTFRQLLLQVRETLLAAYARQTYPYEQIVSYLAPGRKDLSLLLDVVLALDGLHGELSPVESNVTIFVGREGRELSATVEFNSRLYDRETVSRLTGHWVTLLESGLANVDAPLGRLEMLTRAERTRLLVEWGGGADGPVEECLTEMFERQARERPGAVALAFEQGELTYAELDARANQLARHLRSLGVGPERLVALCLDRTPELVVALLGVLKAGGAYLPLDPASPPQRLAFMLADAAAMLVLTDSAHEQALADGKAPVLRLDAEAALIARQESGPLLPIGLLPAHAAYVIYTSGSTGQPKGVVVTHGNVSRLLRVTQPQFGFDHRDVWTLFHSYAFDVSVWEMWGALAHGGTLVVVPYWVSRSPESFLRLLRERRVTVLDQTPSAFQQLVRAEAEQAGEGELALRVVIFAGEALDAAALAPWIERHGDERPQLINMYGITETTVHSTYHRVRACEASDPLRRSLIGRGLGDLRLYILDAELNPAPVGVRGEIYVGGAGVSRGYLGRSGLTAERFVPDALGDEPGARLYRSGDLGRWNGEGVIEYEGRIDEQVKIRGYRIELGEITALLSQHDAVREALVTVSSGEGDKRLNAYVVPEQGRALDVGELKSYLKERLPDYMTPTSFTVLDAFPLTINGKIDRRALPAPGQERRHLGSAFVAPGTQTEELLARIWVQVLGVEQVGVNDNFFELGGHSLLATQVMLRVRETFGVEPPLRELFDSPTVAGLGRSVDARKRAEAQGPPLVAVSRDEDLPLSYAQHRLWFLDQLQPGSPLYNISLALRLRGDLHVEALRATFAAIVRRHESLRTVFTQRNGVPSQRILPAEAAEELTSFSVTDLCDLGDAERQDAARRLAGEEAARPFDLGAGPLLRISLLRLGAAEHVLTVTMHHIVSDGWSVGVLVREVASLYSAFVAGRPSPLPELEIQYADFAAWQRRWLTGDTLESQLAYWRAQLDGAAGEVLSLPTDRPRPAVQTGNGARVSFTLDPELGRKLAAFAHGEDATLFMAVLAAFQSLLYRYTGQERVSVGAPIANRVRRETEGLIGLFMNTLVMRADLSSDPCFRDLLRQVREVCLGAYAHQDLPFERLVEELQVERDVSRSPLFQVMCVLHNTPQVALELPGLELRDEPRDAVTAKFDLTLSLVEDAGALSGFFEYNTDLFEEATIRRMLGHFGVLLEGALADPDRRISALPMLGEDERARLLSGLNDTARDYPRARLLHHDFEARAASDPDAVALLFEGERVTYGELDARAGRVARRLRALGVGAEALVGVCLERSPGM
ncbi:MAG TPA: amino acid adenylation domain-containing protein, partial [Pyrinomonadaceae bacterium]